MNKFFFKNLKNGLWGGILSATNFDCKNSNLDTTNYTTLILIQRPKMWFYFFHQTRFLNLIGFFSVNEPLKKILKK